MKYSILLSVGILIFPYAFSQTVMQFRGQDRAGVYNETGLLKEWPANGPELLWSVNDLPKGYSSVSTDGGAIYLTGISNNEDIVVSLDLNGKKRWETAYGRSWNQSFPESRCTPTIDNGRLYLSSGLGDVVCIDAADGKIIWSLKASDEYEGSYGNWGIAESILIIGEKLIFSPGGKSTAVVALNKSDGKLIWKSESLDDNPSYTSPILINHNGKQQIINVSQSYIFAVAPEDGKMIWKFNFMKYENPGDADINTNSPLYYNGGVFVSDGYNHGGVMLKLSDDGNSASPAWFSNVLDTHHGGYVRVGEYIYGSNWVNNGMGNWVCLDWNTGKTMFETAWFNKGPIISDGEMLYCQDEKSGNFGIAKADPEKFAIISSFKIPLGTGPYWAHPVICNGVLYARHGSALMAYKIR